MSKKSKKAKARATDLITGSWSSPDGLWVNQDDPDGVKVGNLIRFSVESGKSRYKSYVGICTRDDNTGSRQDYDFYGDKNRNGGIDKRDKLLGSFWTYTYKFISRPIYSGTFTKVDVKGPLSILLHSDDAQEFTPAGSVGYGGTLGPNYF
jgi:hypothetical protein